MKPFSWNYLAWAPRTFWICSESKDTHNRLEMLSAAPIHEKAAFKYVSQTFLPLFPQNICRHHGGEFSAGLELSFDGIDRDRLSTENPRRILAGQSLQRLRVAAGVPCVW
jgi:hypothetical protein